MTNDVGWSDPSQTSTFGLKFVTVPIRARIFYRIPSQDSGPSQLNPALQRRSLFTFDAVHNCRRELRRKKASAPVGAPAAATSTWFGFSRARHPLATMVEVEVRPPHPLVYLGVR
ncbi:hypothetical protein D3Y55_20615 [Mesorhizobium sp. DCY119]|nr:hypothetical protein D3Y55_20615 [Mesorhizobium sp. DCY119]